MKKLVLAVGMAAVAVIGVTGTVWTEGIREGKWTMTMVTHIPGMEEEMASAMEGMSDEDKAMMQQMMGSRMSVGTNGAGMTTTITECITNDNPVPHRDEEKDCPSTHSINGNTVNFTTTCPDSKSTGTITYQTDTMNGTIQSESAEGRVTIDISGEYVGPCQ